MRPAALLPELEVHDFDPPSGTRRVASVVVLEPTDDLTNALLEACGEPSRVTRLLSVHPVARSTQ
jgi:hypothetical protein